MTPKALAKLVIENKVGGLQIDAEMLRLFPDFGRLFVSELVDAAIGFSKQYLPECSLQISKSEVKVIREEIIPGVGPYINVVGYSHINQGLPSAILAASLFAYEYLYL